MGIKHNRDTTVLPSLPDPRSNPALPGSSCRWIHPSTISTRSRGLQRIDTHGLFERYWPEVRFHPLQPTTVLIG